MRLAFHGGLCCGIKTIFEMGYGSQAPYETVEALEALEGPQNHDQYAYEVASDKRFFHDAAPEETRLERLDRYLAFLSAHRPSGAVEVTVVGHDHDYSQEVWFPLLEERGFKEMVKFKNSNSGNKVRWYVKVYGQ